MMTIAYFVQLLCLKLHEHNTNNKHRCYTSNCSSQQFVIRCESNEHNKLEIQQHLLKYYEIHVENMLWEGFLLEYDHNFMVSQLPALNIL